MRSINNNIENFHSSILQLLFTCILPVTFFVVYLHRGTVYIPVNMQVFSLHSIFPAYFVYCALHTRLTNRNWLSRCSYIYIYIKRSILSWRYCVLTKFPNKDENYLFCSEHIISKSFSRSPEVKIRTVLLLYTCHLMTTGIVISVSMLFTPYTR